MILTVAYDCPQFAVVIVTVSVEQLVNLVRQPRFPNGFLAFTIAYPRRRDFHVTRLFHSAGYARNHWFS